MNSRNIFVFSFVSFLVSLVFYPYTNCAELCVQSNHCRFLTTLLGALFVLVLLSFALFLWDYTFGKKEVKKNG